MTVLKETIPAIQKVYGKMSIVKLGENVDWNYDTLSTGSISLDKALSGGIARGRTVEIYGSESSGKSTIALHLIAEAQKDGQAAYIDVEHTFDPRYAKAIGVNVNDLWFSQPNTAEEALDIIEALAATEEITIIVVDSVAALVPRQEVEGDSGDANIGKIARLMSQHLRKVTPIASKCKTTIMYINQLRMKIGVMFGCFHYNARVLLADGTTEMIGKIVNQKIPCEVLSHNKSNGKIEKKKIVNWFNNGKAKQFKQYVIAYPHGNGRCSLPIGDDHTIFTPEGKRLASTLKVGHEVLVKSKYYLNKEQKELILGCFLGDGCLRKKSGNTFNFRMQHGEKQNAYCRWKIDQLPKSFISCLTIDKRYNNLCFESKRTEELSFLNGYKKYKAVNFVDNSLLEEFSLLSLAIWYLDDGWFDMHRCTENGTGRAIIYTSKLDWKSKIKIVKKLKELGIELVTYTKRGIVFNDKSLISFHKKIVKYIPSCMSYKIHPSLRHLCGLYQIDKSDTIRDVLIPAKVVKIYNRPDIHNKYKYDIQVEGNSNYFVDNVNVHNSPETTPGGMALKYHASVRLDVRRRATLKDKDKNLIGITTKVKVAKNKTGPPLREAFFDILYGEGINHLGEVFDVAVKKGVIVAKGSWFSFDNEQLAQGRENAIAKLKEDKELCKRIEEKL